jgi:hypothetical protein
MGNGIYFFDIFDIINVFELLPKTCNFTICSIFSNSGHVGWCTASPDTILKLDTLVMILTKFGFHWSSTFRGEDFWKSLRSTPDAGCQVMAIAHMTLRVRWAKKVNTIYHNIYMYIWKCIFNNLSISKIKLNISLFQSKCTLRYQMSWFIIFCLYERMHLPLETSNSSFSVEEVFFLYLIWLFI